jgi:hypothetical protein
MTPLEMAKTQCPNYAFDGCDNIMILDDLRLVRRDPLQRCLIALGKRCDYFEECVLPITTVDPHRHKEVAEAVESYRKLHDLGQKDAKKPKSLTTKSRPAF